MSALEWIIQKKRKKTVYIYFLSVFFSRFIFILQQQQCDDRSVFKANNVVVMESEPKIKNFTNRKLIKMEKLQTAFLYTNWKYTKPWNSLIYFVFRQLFFCFWLPFCSMVVGSRYSLFFLFHLVCITFAVNLLTVISLI